MSAVEAIEAALREHLDATCSICDYDQPSHLAQLVGHTVRSMPAEQVAELIGGESKVDTMVEWYDTGRPSGQMVFGRDATTVQTILFRPGQYVTTKLVAIDPECPHDSLSGTDQTDLANPWKMWRCDGCGAAGTDEAFRLASPAVLGLRKIEPEPKEQQ